MRDYDYTFETFNLKPFADLKTAPSFNSRTPSDIEVKEFFTRRGHDDRMVLAGLDGIPVELTRAKLKGLQGLIFVLDEAVKHPDEAYLFKGKNLYYYTYFKFYQDRAVMVDISFSISQPFRVDRLQVLKGDAIDRARKGVLFYAETTKI